MRNLDSAPSIQKRIGNSTNAASWNGIHKAPQYTASKHGVLGLMRALDPIVAEEDIRIAVIHPWFAGNLIISLSILRRLDALDAR